MSLTLGDFRVKNVKFSREICKLLKIDKVAAKYGVQ